MKLKRRLRERALELGFADAGFTNTEPLDLFSQEIDSPPPDWYEWTKIMDANLRRGAHIKEKYRWTRSLLLLIRNYHKKSRRRSAGRSLGGG